MDLKPSSRSWVSLSCHSQWTDRGLTHELISCFFGLFIVGIDASGPLSPITLRSSLSFVEAARLVKQDFPSSRFQLLGRRDERNPTVVSASELDRWQEEGVLTWLGDASDVRPIMAQADVVVLPSYREGTPRSLLEAAAMGKPIITTRTVGCREVVEDGVNGLLVPLKDAKALADA